MKKLVISPSILSANFCNLEKDIKELEKYVTHIHIDVMDGMFVPNISFGFPVISALRKITNLFFDIHVMVENPERYIDEFVKCGANSITVHIEATKHIHRVVQQIKSHNIKASVAINPGTSIEAVLPIINDVDMILVMSVNPGFGGQKFIPEAVDKIKKLRRIKPDLDIQVDGGINEKTAVLVKEAGANNLVAGSYIFLGDFEERIKSLM